MTYDFRVLVAASGLADAATFRNGPMLHGLESPRWTSRLSLRVRAG